MNPSKITPILHGVIILVVCLIVSAPAFASLTGSEAADELVSQMDGKYGRVYVMDDGRIVVQIGTLEPGTEPTDPPVFVEENVVGFEPENQLSSLSVLIVGSNKYIDVDDETAGQAGGGKDVSKITLSEDPQLTVSAIEGDIEASRPTFNKVVVTISNSASSSTLSFSADVADMELDDVSASQQGSEPCCQVTCPNTSQGQTSSSCILCSCSCSIFTGNAVAICWINRIRLTLLATELI